VKKLVKLFNFVCENGADNEKLFDSENKEESVNFFKV
jgi:hypothetical protein